MEVVNNVRALLRLMLAPQTPRARPGAPAGSPGRLDDLVELSPDALRVTQDGDLTNLRGGLIDSVRRQIDQGTYLTPEKLDVAFERALGDIESFDVTG